MAYLLNLSILTCLDRVHGMPSLLRLLIYIPRRLRLAPLALLRLDRIPSLLMLLIVLDHSTLQHFLRVLTQPHLERHNVRNLFLVATVT
jgi:hypothetical protein